MAYEWEDCKMARVGAAHPGSNLTRACVCGMFPTESSSWLYVSGVTTHLLIAELGRSGMKSKCLKCDGSPL